MLFQKLRTGLTLLTCTLLTAFVSCKEDAETPDLLTGKWSFNKSIEWEYDNQVKIESTKKVYELIPEMGESLILEFTSSGKATSKASNGQSWEGTFTIIDNGSAVMVRMDNEPPKKLNIKELTNKKLVIESTNTYEDDPKIYWIENHYSRL